MLAINLKRKQIKHKIAVKLTLYFSATLLLFSLIIGGVFITLFRNHTMEVHRSDLEKRAVTMSDTLSKLIDGTSTGWSGNGMGGGYRAYLRFLDDIAMADVWIVDENLQLLMSGVGGMQYHYADLPQNAEAVVKTVFEGDTVFSEGFSDLLNSPTLTVGTPIKSDGLVMGALLLHSPVQGIDDATTRGIYILAISMIVALLLSVILSIILSLNFTKPLKNIKNSAMQLANGDYSAKTGVHLNDEIGELALSVDCLSERLDLASHQSETLDQLRRDFVANISHELRTPVTVIRGSLEAICDHVVTDPEQVKSYHHQMLIECLYLQRLVNDLLDLSRLQNTQFKMELQEVNLCEVLGDVVRSAQHIAQAKSIAINFEQDTKVCTLIGDYGRLRQMFFIILDNAIKFSRQGEVVTVLYKDNSVFIRDHGIGIAQEDLPFVFDRFYKAKSENNKSGTGLGLAIAKQIAERHEIVVSVCSTENEGTEFQFELSRIAQESNS